MSLKSSESRGYSLVMFFVITYTASWALWVPMALSSQGIVSTQVPPILGIVLGGMSPSLTATVLTVLERRKEGFRGLSGSLFRWRVAVHWYLFALFAPAVTMLGALALHTLLTTTSLELPRVGNWSAVLALFLFTLVFGGPLGEEVGWRGYALPRLQTHQSALLASLVVGTLWGLWHLPLFWIRGSLQEGVPIIGFLASILAESVLYTWVYNHTRGSLLVVCLFHAAINTWAKIILLPMLVSTLQPLLFTFGLEVVLAVIVVVPARSEFLSKSQAR